MLKVCKNASHTWKKTFVKGKQQEKKFIVKVLVAMWPSEISDCILSPQGLPPLTNAKWAPKMQRHYNKH
jgi:hypothetical protein